MHIHKGLVREYVTARQDGHDKIMDRYERTRYTATLAGLPNAREIALREANRNADNQGQRKTFKQKVKPDGMGGTRAPYATTSNAHSNEDALAWEINRLSTGSRAERRRARDLTKLVNKRHARATAETGTFVSRYYDRVSA